MSMQSIQGGKQGKSCPIFRMHVSPQVGENVSMIWPEAAARSRRTFGCQVCRREPAGAVRSVAEWLLSGLAATAERDGRLVARNGKGVSLMVDDRHRSLDHERPIFAATDFEF
jgi:hypothetical protein